MSRQDKHRLISAGSTFVIMALLFIFMIFCGFTNKIPPDPPKKIVMVELEEFGDGHQGGGNRQAGGSSGEDRTPPTAADETAVNTSQPTTQVRQNTHTEVRSNVKQTSTPAQQQPKVNNNALFKGAPSNGQGTGKDLGAGHQRGNGLGLGTDGSGGNTTGRGLGTGTRKYRGTPNLTVNVDEQPGNRVYVEVDVNGNGDVVGAKVLNNKQYKTTATVRTQNLCLERAKTVKYVSNGIAEYRVIVFTF